MLLRWPFVLALGGAIWSAAIAVADDRPDPDSIALLVRRLGDRSFRMRERAERALTEIGLPAKEALTAAAASEDLEVRNRARSILQEVAATELDRRVREFLSPNAEPSSGLPGWERFSTMVGESRNARRLYAQIYHSEPELIDAMETSPVDASDMLIDRADRLRQSVLMDRQFGGDPEIPRIPGENAAALVFASLHDAALRRDEALQIVVDIAISAADQPFGDQRELLPHWRKLLSACVAADYGGEPAILYHQLRLACVFRLPSGAQAARRMLENASLSTQFLPYATLGLAQVGSAADLPALERWFDHRTAIFAAESVNIGTDDETRLPVEARDLALFAAVHLTGQKPEEYGFSQASPEGLWGFAPNTLSFQTAQARDDAFAKWVAWQASQK